MSLGFERSLRKCFFCSRAISMAACLGAESTDYDGAVNYFEVGSPCSQ